MKIIKKNEINQTIKMLTMIKTLKQIKMSKIHTNNVFMLHKRYKHALYTYITIKHLKYNLE